MGETLIGFFPERIEEAQPEHSEACELADMIAVALRLSASGAGDCWDDADRWLRNMFAESQLRRTGWVGRVPFAGPLEGVQHVWAQDLLATEATDIQARTRIAGCAMSIPGRLIDEIGVSAGDKGDISAPGMVLRLEGESLPRAGGETRPG